MQKKIAHTFERTRDLDLQATQGIPLIATWASLLKSKGSGFPQLNY